MSQFPTKRGAYPEEVKKGADPRKGIKDIAAAGGKPSGVLKARGKNPLPGGFSKAWNARKKSKAQKKDYELRATSIHSLAPEKLRALHEEIEKLKAFGKWNPREGRGEEGTWTQRFDVEYDPFTGQPKRDKRGNVMPARPIGEAARHSNLQDEAMRRYREYKKTLGPDQQLETMELGWDPASGLEGNSDFLAWAKSQPEYEEIVRQRIQHGTYDPNDPFKYRDYGKQNYYQALGPYNLPFGAALNKSGQ